MSKKDIIIISAGGHGKSLKPILEQLGYKVLGFADNSTGENIIGDDQHVINNFSKSDVLLVNGIGYLGKGDLRKAVFENYKKEGFEFLTLIAPSAYVCPTAELEEGSQVLNKAIINSHSKVLSNTIINTGVIIEHDCTIKEHSHIAPGAIVCGGVKIGEESFVGAGATVVQQVLLDKGTFVKAGSVRK